MARKPAKSRQLVDGHLERVSRELLEKHRDVINEFARGQHGIYALYNGKKLYYVGLAINLPSRLAAHLKDRHADTWDNFSLYQTRKLDHMKELESLILKIFKPKGNKVSGKFAGSKNLHPLFRKALNEQHKRHVDNMLGRKKRRAEKTKPATQRRPKSKKQAVLAPYVDSRFKIRIIRGDKVIKASVRSNGTIFYAGQIYKSPSNAAKVALNIRACNGWKAWKYRNDQGEWIWLNELRKGKKSKAAGTKKQKKTREPVLAPYVTKRFKLRLERSGKVYEAWVMADGRIKYDGVLYTSPTTAAKTALGLKVINGWKAWKYKNADKKWVWLDELRR